MEATLNDVAADCAAAGAAARLLATAPEQTKNTALEAIATGLLAGSDEILRANAADLSDERASGLSAALIDRLTLDAGRIDAMAAGVREVAALDDPVGEELEARTLESGLRLRKVRVPLGVVAVIYEARPNVTIDCAALTIKSGNAIVLRGSSYAERTNTALAEVVRAALEQADLPVDSVILSRGGGHDAIAELATQEDRIDLLIPGAERASRTC